MADLLELGAGVCQDFVHLGLILLRRMGIAARYVSGYLWAAPQDGGDDSVEVDTHAWLEALLPGTDGDGEPVWVAPTPRIATSRTGRSSRSATAAITSTCLRSRGSI